MHSKSEAAEREEGRPYYPRHQCIHELFEQRAGATPDAVAIAFNSERITYRQLNERANRLAGFLRQHGIGPDNAVGVCMERCPEMVVCLLGILKAGGAYLPLDPEYPRQRLDYMIRDAAPAVILTQSHLQSLMGDHCPVVCVDADVEALERYSSSNLTNVNTPDNLAYVIYTSGSTGTPKGTAVCHHGVIRLLFGQHYLTFDPTLVVLQLAPVGFDASTLEIWGPLLHGGCCVLYPGRVPELDVLGSVLSNQKVNTLWLTASLFNMVIDEKPQILRPVDTVLTGGEALSVPHIRKALDLLPETQLINGYGPTESTTFACCYRIPRHLPEDITSIPIGTPIAHTQVYVLDDRMQPVADGHWGQLYIGGDGLARGYLNQPELTAERFVPNPFDGQAGDRRLYQTGDVCRWNNEGLLEFQGRVDDQVKIRGYRIELGEIENTLRRCPGIRQAAVTVREDVTGQKYLAGYFAQEPETTLSVDAVRAWLTERLPGYMIPAFLVPLKRMPLTAHGKVDRAALPEPTRSDDQQKTRTPARTAIEMALAQCWKSVLGLESDVCCEDNFFELGGHSLKALQVVHRMQRRYGVDLDVSDLFDHPTLAAFASVVSQGVDEPKRKTQSIICVSRDNPIPLSYAQRRMWFIQQISRGLPVYNESWMIQMRGNLDSAALEKSLDTIISRHESFRTSISVYHGEPMQTIQSHVPWSLPIERIDAKKEDIDVVFGRIAEGDAKARIDLEQGPLFRFTLLDAGGCRYALLLTMHHLITDGWSMGVFMEELTLLYKHFALKAPLALPDLPVQYADFSCWQRETIEFSHNEDFEYWKEKLSGSIAVCTIPEDYPRPESISCKGTWEYYQPDEHLLAALQEVCRKHNVTLYSLLLCAYQILLAQLTGQQEVVVGSPVSGRTHKDTERVIGFFVNTIVLRGHIEQDVPFSEMLKKTYRDCVEAQRHQGLPYDLLVEWLNPPRNPRYNLHFQTMLAYQDARYWTPDLPGMVCRTTEISTQTSKLDLIIFAEENHNRLCFRAEYNTDLYRRATIQRTLEQYEKLLASLAENPDLTVSMLGQIAGTAMTTKVAYQATRDVQPAEPADSLPQTPLETALAQLWAELLGIDRVYRNDNFFHLGGNSLKAATLFYRIKENFHVGLPLGLIFETPTLAALAGKIEAAGNEAIVRDSVQIKQGCIDQAIFYLPGVGGHTLNFYHLANSMTIPLSQYGLNLPGLDGARPILHSIEAMASYFITQITAVQPKGPYYLCGFSMGGTIAYEMALQLNRQGQKVAFLAVLGTPAPGVPRTFSFKPLHYLDRFCRFCRISVNDKKRYIKDRMDRRKKRLRKRQDDTIMAANVFNPAQFRQYKTMYKAGLSAFAAYRPTEHYSGSMVLFREIARPNPLYYDMYEDPEFGWGRYIDGPITVYDIACEHPNIVHKPHVDQCAALLENEVLKTLGLSPLR